MYPITHPSHVVELHEHGSEVELLAIQFFPRFCTIQLLCKTQTTRNLTFRRTGHFIGNTYVLLSQTGHFIGNPNNTNIYARNRKRTVLLP